VYDWLQQDVLKLYGAVPRWQAQVVCTICSGDTDNATPGSSSWANYNTGVGQSEHDLVRRMCPRGRKPGGTGTCHGPGDKTAGKLIGKSGNLMSIWGGLIRRINRARFHTEWVALGGPANKSTLEQKEIRR
jgi:hypothetical protein